MLDKQEQENLITQKLIKMTTTQKLIQPKMGLLKLAEKLEDVSEAFCYSFGMFF